MIKSLLLKNCLSFDEVNLEFGSGLIIFTGPSGAGKSVLMGGMLSSFGLCDSPASLCESVLDMPLPSELIETGIENEEENVFRVVKKEKAKQFVNSQTVSKKNLLNSMQNIIVHLSSKEGNEFDSKSIIARLDSFIGSKRLDELKMELSVLFIKYDNAKKELDLLIKKEHEAEEQKEFLSFEIQKIEKIAPKIGEDEELLEIKKLISRREKSEELIHKCQPVGFLRERVLQLFDHVAVDTGVATEFFSQFDDAMIMMSKKMRDLDSYDIDYIMNRLEELSSIKKRYGSIEDALNTLVQKKDELKLLQNIEIVKDTLEKDVKKLLNECHKIAKEITDIRAHAIASFEGSVSGFLQKLFLANANFILSQKSLCFDGEDYIGIKIGSVEPSRLSAGEFRRARLAMMCVGLDMDIGKKILIVDEADANVSGEESAAIAKTLKLLSKKYQIFAISHQPQLSALADTHYYVVKKDGNSSVREIKEEERAMEIARIVSGENITIEAVEYAKRLLQEC